jgi:16S rRNA (guanine527-N7)-methyltransferase
MHAGGSDRAVDPALPRSFARCGLEPGQLAQLEEVLLELERDPHAPTSVRNMREAADAHIADSLAGLEIDEIRVAKQLTDLGSGAGFPGIPLAVALPHAQVSLVESQRRKCEFLERLCTRVALGNVKVVHARAEEWAEGIERSDVVVARALAPQAVVVEYAAPLLRLGGVLADWRGRRSVEQERAAIHAAEQVGLRLREILHVEPFAGARDRHVHVFTKLAVTPPRFPRRAGIARKRPLGGPRGPAGA